MTIEEAIKHCENVRDGAMVVLEGGFGTHEGEHTLMYDRRIEYANICLSALHAQQERENPRPLTVDELLEMDGQPVWVEKLFECVDCSTGWVIGANRWAKEGYGTTWISYRYPPKFAVENTAPSADKPASQADISAAETPCFPGQGCYNPKI